MKQTALLLALILGIIAIAGAEASFNITAVNNYDGASINTFNATITGTIVNGTTAVVPKWFDLSATDTSNWVGNTRDVNSIYAFPSFR